VAKLSDPNFKRTIEIAIDLGSLIMVTDMDRANIYIESLIKRQIVMMGPVKMI
jgi:hypothetical protein